MVEAVVQLLDTATMSRTQTVDLANLMWAIAHTDVRVAPALLLSFSVSLATTSRCVCTLNHDWRLKPNCCRRDIVFECCFTARAGCYVCRRASYSLPPISLKCMHWAGHLCCPVPPGILDELLPSPGCSATDGCVSLPGALLPSSDCDLPVKRL